MAGLFVDVLLHYRQEEKYLLHEFVVMTDYFHLLITPTQTLERVMQLIKGGFSFRARESWDLCMRFGSPVTMTGECGMSRSIWPFENTSGEIR
jgi:REP element-mobilizing transposase RayT